MAQIAYFSLPAAGKPAAQLRFMDGLYNRHVPPLDRRGEIPATAVAAAAPQARSASATAAQPHNVARGEAEFCRYHAYIGELRVLRAEWGIKDPVASLVSALYGHPDAGTMWEYGGERRVKSLGWEPVDEVW